MLAQAVKWEIIEWFGDIQGIRNAGVGYAEDVLVFGDDGSILADVYEVPSLGEVSFSIDESEVSVSWRDRDGMHADVIRLEEL